MQKMETKQLRQDRVGEDAGSRHGGRTAECTFSGLADQRREVADWFTAKSNQKRWRGIIGNWRRCLGLDGEDEDPASHGGGRSMARRGGG